jgi:hypothetical protein
VVLDSAQNLDTNPELRQTSEAIVLENRKLARGKRLHLKALVRMIRVCPNSLTFGQLRAIKKANQFVNLASSDAL